MAISTHAYPVSLRLYCFNSLVLGRKLTTSIRCKSDQFRRSDFSGQGFTGYYEPGQPTAGPLGDVSAYGAPRITPRVLEQHLSNYIVGQDRGKRVMSVAVYNHYLRVREIQRQEEEAERLTAQQERQAMSKHPVDGTTIDVEARASWY